MDEIRSILEPDAAGDPMSDKRWTHETSEKIAQCLAQRLGIKVSATVVRRLLGDLQYSLKSNKKCLSAGNSPDRDPPHTSRQAKSARNPASVPRQ